MSDVLDQSEIDALLSAVDGGGVDLGAVADEADEAEINVQTYDFKRPERVGKEQARALETLHDAFARNFGAALSGYLRTIVEVSVSHIEQLSYSEFIHSLPNPTCFNLIGSEELDGKLCLEISPLIVYPIIDRLLGGSNADLFIPQRPLTQIEQRLVQRVTDRATHHLGEAWSQIVPAEFKVVDFESNPQLVQIVPPNETVVVVGFEIKMGHRAGTMSLCIPYQAMEPIMSRVSQQSWFSYENRRGPGDAGEKKLASGLESAAVELKATLAKTTITLSELINLRPGDILTTEKPESTDVVIDIAGRNKFTGRIGQFRGNKAIRLTRVVRDTRSPSEPLPAPEAKPTTQPATAAA
ncbi:MAG: flagellar motor switch protein FliM [Planctomycetota bacterium]